MSNIVIVENCEYLAKLINHAHREAVFNGRAMLTYAAEAGRRLLQVKGKLKHGEFGEWVKENCSFPERTARRYMQLAKTVVNDHFDLDATIDSVLDTNAHRRGKVEAAPAFDRDDAAHALKLQALVERGSTEAERDVAWNKLNAYAKGFGMAPEELVIKAQDMLPNAGKTADQIELDKAEARIAELEARLAEIAKVRSALLAEFSTYPKEKLVDLCTRLTMQMEGYSEPSKKAA